MTDRCYKSYIKTFEREFKRGETEACNDEVEEEEISFEDDENRNPNVESNRSGTRKSQRFSGEGEIASGIFENCFICDGKGTRRYPIHHLTDGLRAQKLFDYSRSHEDDIFKKTSAAGTYASLLTLGLQYHNKCLKNYESLYENKSTNQNSENTSELLSTENVISTVIAEIKSKIELGRIFELSEVSALIEKKHEIKVKNDSIKQYLIKLYKDQIIFAYPEQRNKSQIFYLKNVQFSQNEIHVRECAKVLRESIQEPNFDLKDKFCDVNDLKKSMEKSSIPYFFLIFFSIFFNVKVEELEKKPETIFSKDSSVRKNIKLLRINSLFQAFYFIFFKGLKKTPLQTLLGLFVYSSNRSKSTITILNRLGLSISYDEVLRIRTCLASYASSNCPEGCVVPLPSNFNPDTYVTAAFDNFDQNEATISCLNSTHDTVSVLFQNHDNYDKMKPNLSEFKIDKRNKTFSSVLDCQLVKEYYRPKGPTVLPESFKVSAHSKILTEQDYHKDLQSKDFMWLLSRMNIVEDKILTTSQNQHVPAWSSFNSILVDDKRDKQKIGYLPILPAPVTQAKVVYTALCNFLDVLKQLKQNFLPIFCDEGVYHIARRLQFENEEKFEKLKIFLGPFHEIKILLSCIGKYLKESGADIILNETELFGERVTEQVLRGTDYARSVKAFNYLYEALRRLQLKEFFNTERLKEFEQVILTVKVLQNCFQENEYEEAKSSLQNFDDSYQSLLNEFKKFVEKRSNESENFRYWNNVLNMISLMHDMIRADRSGDLQLTIKSIKKLQPIFCVMDRVNYTRWGAVYVQDMLNLEKDANEVYLQFMNGQHTVKKTTVPFTSVAPDQALEQTINRSSKGPGGFLGFTRKKESVAVWDLSYHELLAICNYFKELTFLNNNNDELQIHHEYSVRTIENSEVAVNKILNYLDARNINPFSPKSERLKNIVTQRVVEAEAAKKILNIFDTGIELNSNFITERFEEKNKPLSATIPIYDLPHFKSFSDNETNLKDKEKLKKSSAAQNLRIVALAQARNYPMDELLKYEITYNNQLFDDDGLLKKEANKSLLVRELETKLTYTDLNSSCKETETCLVVDIMYVLRKFSWKTNKNIVTFQDLCKAVCNYVYDRGTEHFNIKRVDFVFDSYFENSLKSSEHERRHKKDPVCLNEIDDSTRYILKKTKIMKNFLYWK